MKKLFTTFICAFLLVLLAGCTQTTEAPKKQENEIDKIELTPGDSFQISFWHIWGQSKSAFLDEMIAEFTVMMKDKYDVTVEITSTSQSNYNTLLEKTNKAIAAGDKASMPNIVIGYPDHFAGYIKSEAVLSLDDYIDSVNYGIDRADFLQSYLDENNQFGGITYSLPLTKSTEVMVYNKSAIDAYNATVDAADKIVIPYDRALTWEELTPMWEKLKGFKGANGYCNFQYLVNYDSTDNMFINFARQLNCKYTTQDGQLLVTDESTQAMISLIQNYAKKGYVSIPLNYADGASYGSDYFQQQMMPFTIGSSAGVTYDIPSELSDTVKELFEGGIAMVPQFATDINGNAATPSVVQQGPNVCLLDSGTEEEDLVCWLFLKYLTSQDQYNPDNANANEEGFVVGQNNSARTAIGTHYFPVTYSAFNSELYTNYMGIAKKYFEAGYDKSVLSKAELEELIYSEVAYVSYLQKDLYKFDPAFAASSTLLGSASIRTYAGDCIDKIVKDPTYSPIKALQEMVDSCTLG